MKCTGVQGLEQFREEIQARREDIRVLPSRRVDSLTFQDIDCGVTRSQDPGTS